MNISDEHEPPMDESAMGAGETPVPWPPEESLSAHELELDTELLPTHEQMESLRRERDEYLDQLQRMTAEFANFRRRMERDRAAMSSAATRNVILQVLPVLDNLERGVDALRQQGSPLAEGVEMVRVQLAQVLTANGVQEVDAHGQLLDPNVHDAIASEPTDTHPEGVIVTVVEKGYRTEQGVLRAAKVVVASAPITPEPGSAEA